MRIARWLGRLVCLAILVPLMLTIAYAFVPPVSTLMLARWLTFQDVDRRWISLRDMAPSVAVAVMTAEDARFCLHHGVDWDALREVLDDEDEPSRGASTISQQTVKNLFLWGGRSYIRKAIEIPMAVAFDLVLPKRRVLEIYLNVAEWGDGIFGVEAAARRHFNKSSRILSVREAAALAAALPNPIRRNPARPAGGHRMVMETVLRRMNTQNLDTGCLGK
ncbi:monofunctional biosynthetic peptidoglycan transglycosylase [Terrarubrum flagellatum]|uniref:monofunctional biosynthetic peptidoglycan transglycosylase n=1 Tax=Terrirubrum flagellatum TaxID=2895980 RepID=UPI003145264B